MGTEDKLRIELIVSRIVVAWYPTKSYIHGSWEKLEKKQKKICARIQESTNVVTILFILKYLYTDVIN